MAQKGIIKNTTDNESYISASDWAYMQDSLIGQSGVMDYKERLEVVKINDNTVRIKSGVYFLNGKAIVVDNYEDITIDSGSLGVKRYDYIIAEYVKDGESEGNDFLGFRVLKGIPSADIPQKPELTNNDVVEQEILCLIYIDEIILSIQEKTEKGIIQLSQLYSKNEIDDMRSKKVLLTKQSVSANTSITLNDSIEKYDFILVEVQGDNYGIGSLLISVSDIVYSNSTSTHQYEAVAFQKAAVYAAVQFRFTNATTLTTTGHVVAAWSKAWFRRAYGIRI
ncbi:hypothetical protein M2475_000921 [Breznakia sp. PF5-3]|uniref:hypothetical protein n=1 Tax=unclassified Breznakia TaxID=2623764 RepID=UPI0024071A10|nr:MULTISPECIES: hypothetical protein [unclassified Breznakia]MDF9824693.1 hypothetical protein [Breznakia sp. PM6-1]MDF9835356.1 hypothetical protein [Breznakia sp. PF5-3]MDF9836955.1 hypothetical protein [Breznakia sp. PFB2-8]MDF9859591.1 hypothetical protein [Breznakia sp. PH5-24]